MLHGIEADEPSLYHYDRTENRYFVDLPSPYVESYHSIQMK
jgi:hypothetical protein